MPKPINPYDLKLLRNQAAINKKILKVFEDGILTLTPTLTTVKFRGQLFALKDYPALNKKVEQMISKMQPRIYTTLVNGIKESWDLSNQKNNILVDKRLAGKRPNGRTKKILYDPNHDALSAFIDRKEKGIKLSDRVWKTLDPFKKEIEQSLAFGISKGESAASMTRDLKQHLRNPDKLFRRVRTEEGKLVLSKAARDYHPGQGVYRSSYKNALRVSRTEVNGAYRSADYERWQKLPFVTGISIKLSNQHPRYDICDTLVGIYPKDFKFQGWHPQCICFATPEMMDDEQYNKLEDQILRGEPINVPSSDLTRQPPEAFAKYIADNKKMLGGLKNEPYWLKDNKQYIDTPPAEIKKATAGGNKISTQFSKISSSIKNTVNNTLTSIDAVHGDGELDDIPFKKTTSKKFNASFSSEWSGKASHISLSVNTKAPEISIAHEIGHYLDLYSVGVKGKWNSVIPGSPINKVVQVAEQSDEIKNIKQILDNGFVVIDGKKQPISPYGKAHLRYLLNPKEIWARSYAQFIAKKSESTKMLQSLEELADRERKLAYRHQWEHNDFENISDAIEEMMKELGWIISQ